MYGSEIARTLEVTTDSVLDAVQYLVDTGLAVKGQRVGVGGVKPIALNRSLPIYPELKRLLLAMDRHWPIARAKTPNQSTLILPYNNVMPERLLRQIFISPIRTRVLLYIATSGRTPLSAISRALGAHRMSVLSAVNLWETEGVIRSRHIEGVRVLSLDPDFPIARELLNLINAVVSRN
jgi:hypothetical protein